MGSKLGQSSIRHYSCGSRLKRQPPQRWNRQSLPLYQDKQTLRVAVAEPGLAVRAPHTIGVDRTENRPHADISAAVWAVLSWAHTISPTPNLFMDSFCVLLVDRKLAAYRARSIFL